MIVVKNIQGWPYQVEIPDALNDLDPYGEEEEQAWDTVPTDPRTDVRDNDSEDYSAAAVFFGRLLS